MDDTDKLIKLATVVGKLREQLSELSAKTETITKLEGPQGPKGDRGSDGRDGIDGRDGKDGKDGKDGQDGSDGKDGISVVNLDIAADGHLVVYLSDGSEIDAGLVSSSEASYVLSQSKTNLINSVDFLDFNLAATGVAGAVGRFVWNDTDGTLDLGLKGGNVTLQLGQEIVQPVTNKTGTTLVDMEVVYVTGAQGNRMTVGRALADSDLTSAAVLGVVTEHIADNQTGFVTTEGMVRNVDTSGFAEGAVLYLSPTVAGVITSTKPVAPQHTVMVGYCVRSHASVGSIYVKVQNGYELEELHNVLITTPSDGQVLKYEASTGLWKNGAAPAGTETDPIYTASSWYTTTNNSTNWNTAYGWGNHTSAGYLTSAAIGTTIQAYDADLTSWAALSPSSKQDTLVSGTNIKTINGNSLLGSGNLTISGGGGAAQVNTATIDFGATPVSDGSFTVTDANISSTSYVQIFMMGDSTVDNDAEAHRHAGASWQFSVIPNSGSFTVYINNMTDLCWGTFKIRYSYA